jgi:hypothetical protein
VSGLWQRLRTGWAHLEYKLREEDKQQHMLWSFWLMQGACILWPMPWALLAVWLAGLGKEIWDARYGSGFCWYDMLGNMLGLLAAVIFISLAPEGLYQA